MNEQVSQTSAEAVGGVGGIGQAAQQAQSPAAPVTRSASKKAKPAKRSNGQAATTTSPDPNIRVCSITLPKDVYEWYEQQAAAAPFEPSVQRYIAWELRQRAALARHQVQVLSQAQAQTQELAARGFVPDAAGADGLRLDDFGR
jgi:hypothetical protein